MWWKRKLKSMPGPSCCAARRMSRFGVSSVQRAWAVRPIVGKALEQHHSCRQRRARVDEAPVAVEVVVIVAMVAMVFGKTPIPVVVALED